MEENVEETWEFPQLEEIKESEWFKSRPAAIQQMILNQPPICLYKFKDSGKVVYMYSYSEDGTVSVIHLGYGTEFAIVSEGFKVFGVKPEDLEAIPYKESARIMNEVDKRKTP